MSRTLLTCLIMFSKPLSAHRKTFRMLLETFTIYRGHAANMSCETVNMSWEPFNMSCPDDMSWELVTMSWEPVHMYGTLLPCHESLISYTEPFCMSRYSLKECIEYLYMSIYTFIISREH
jgi:hypothetical protein